MSIGPILAARTRKWGQSLAFVLMGLWRKAALIKRFNCRISIKIRHTNRFLILTRLLARLQPWALALVCSLFVGLTACGGNASPNETHHVHGGPGHMYQKGSALSDTNGCGAKFIKGEIE